MPERKLLMPKATAAWLVENTSLTFEQIAHFCQMHLLEVKGIADGDVAAGIKGMDPISSGQLTREEIRRGEDNPGYHLRLAESKIVIPQVKSKRGPRYTPVSRRHDRPNAVLWLLRSHPELKDSQIMRLVGTTKPTIQQIRERTHWNSANLVPQDPVTLGLCAQTDLDEEVRKAAARAAKERAAMPHTELAGTLLPAEETAQHAAEPAPAPIDGDSPQTVRQAMDEEEARLLASLQELGSAQAGDDAGAADDDDDDEPRESAPFAASFPAAADNVDDTETAAQEVQATDQAADDDDRGSTER